MPNTPPTVTIFGGTGFIGRYITHRLARAGWRVRVATRRPHEAIFVKQFGEVGQVEPILANIRDEASTLRAIQGADAVINCTNIATESGKQNFENVNVAGADRIARLTAKAGISKLIHISRIAASADSESKYLRSKADGEVAVSAAHPDAVILRTGLAYGTEDKLLNGYASLSRFSLVLPITKGDRKFQPVFVDDIAKAAEAVLDQGQTGKTFELGGPDILSLRELVQKVLTTIDRKRVVLNLPTGIARFKAWFFEVGSKAIGGLYAPLVTRDQIAQLDQDAIVAADASGFVDLGINPIALDSVIDSYLYCYRPKGQYTALTQSGKNIGS